MRTIWQDILAVDSQYNNSRFQGRLLERGVTRDPQQLLRTLYLRRRSQLLKEQISENQHHSDPVIRENYLQLRKQLLAARFGFVVRPTPSQSINNLSLLSGGASGGDGFISHHSRTTSLHSLNLPFQSSQSHQSMLDSNSSSKPAHRPTLVPTQEAGASRSLTGDTSLSEGYAFAGIKHVFDHHKSAVNRIRFAHNDATRLALASSDGTVSICRTWPTLEEQLLALLRGHKQAVMDLAWSNSNDYILSASLDSSVCLWNVEQANLARVYAPQELGVGEVNCCEFQPLNNNLFLVGGNRGGALQMVNLSTGKGVKGGRDKMGGTVLSVTFEPSLGECLWVGNSQSIIQSYRCDVRSGRLTRGRRLTIAAQSSPVCSLQYRSWVSREARDPCLLVNAGGMNYLLFYRVVSPDGQLLLKSRFPIQHKTERIRSCFCPLISFRQGACVVTGSEDTHVYVYDVTITSLGDSKCITLLQGHSSPVTDVAISYDENVMASSDKTGMVILWKRVSDAAIHMPSTSTSSHHATSST